MSDKALRIIGRDIGPRGDQCAPGFRSTTATLLNKEGRARSTAMVEVDLVHYAEKKALAP